MDLAEDEVVDLAARKTACLFSGCARLGGVLGQLSPSEEQALADYGRYAGVAFQLVDDLLDFTGSPAQLGKPVVLVDGDPTTDVTATRSILAVRLAGGAGPSGKAGA